MLFRLCRWFSFSLLPKQINKIKGKLEKKEAKKRKEKKENNKCESMLIQSSAISQLMAGIPEWTRACVYRHYYPIRPVLHH